MAHSRWHMVSDHKRLSPLGNSPLDPLLQWYGHPRVLAISIPKTQNPGDMGIPFSYNLSDLG